MDNVIQQDTRIRDKQNNRWIRTFVLNWSDLKEPVLAGLVDGTPMGQECIDNLLIAMHCKPFWNDGWIGCSGADLVDQLRNGFHAPEFANSAAQIGGALRHAANWNDEDGDVDLGRLVAGQDNFMLGLSERRDKPSIRIQFEYVFSAMVNKKCIAEYGAWIAGLIAAMERYGFDLTVDAWIIADHMTTGDRSNDRTNLLIRVKRENEVSNFTEWSALLGPAGFRILGHAAQAAMCNRLGKQQPYSGMSTLRDRNWGLVYDRELNVVKISCNQRAGGRDAFPGKRLTQLAFEEGLIPDQGEEN